MLTRVSAVLAVVLLSGCALFHTTEQRVQTACVGVTAVTKTLTVYKDKLTPDQTGKVASLLNMLTPVCGYGITQDGLDFEDILTAKRALMQIADYAVSDKEMP